MPESTRKIENARSQLPTRTAGPLSVRRATPVGEAGQAGRAYPMERRNLTSRQALLRRIAMEYDEMPGLRLTAVQAQRLFGLRDDVCMRVFDAFVEAAILRRDANNRYVRYGRL